MANTARKLNIRLFTKRILFCFLFIYLLASLISQQFKFAALDKAHAQKDIEIKAAYEQQETLKAQFEAIDSEDYLRRVIREKLGYTRPNEKVFIDASK